ncbi:uncharacterized protein CLUP02_03695 [Colletotrichum lupini]|uniref:Uncharacterized protein n=1 Tax=Colletotrichum lupini TaxID=145971 RepID=A0A9Q8WCE9_9PEZI|nr:uncharacterized protein CLUP02_03695 [Colletotrichum lupini]UQC78219.1 hypothetical protein CLUP02_03695 [Colletotrichum lupini]
MPIHTAASLNLVARCSHDEITSNAESLYSPSRNLCLAGHQKLLGPRHVSGKTGCHLCAEREKGAPLELDHVAVSPIIRPSSHLQNFGEPWTVTMMMPTLFPDLRRSLRAPVRAPLFRGRTSARFSYASPGAGQGGFWSSLHA